jgi:hypothetical protein
VAGDKIMMTLLNKKHLNCDAVILCISCVVFLLRLYACRFVHPLYSGMDYYGYIELAKNIFHHLDFTVRWELDTPIEYPPFFSILIYLLTYWTKNFITSIQLISIFSASFYLIPLFYLVRNILNIYSAFLAVAFAIYFFGIKPCYLLNMDFFYSFLMMIICWLIWDTLTHRNSQTGRFILAGFLVSLAYVTKFSGILFGYAGMASILYYFVRYQQDLGKGIKKSAWLILGAAPLFMTYHLLLEHNAHKQSPSIAAYAFYDGNYMYENGLDHREERMSEINAQGTEFGQIDRIKSRNEFDFLLKDPLFVWHKFLWGLNVISQDVTFTVLPGGNILKSKLIHIGPKGQQVFEMLKGNGWDGIVREVSSTEVQINRDCFLTKESVRKAAGHDFDKVWKILNRSRNTRMMINFIFQGAFLILLIFSGVFYRWHFNFIHILLFAAGMALIPLYLILERYLIPFMPLYFVLWLFILNAGYKFFEGEIKDKNYLRIIVFVFFVSFVFLCCARICKQVEGSRLYFRDEVKRNGTWLQTAAWIKKDSMDLHHRAKIMSSDNYASYLTNSDFIRLPFVISSWDKVVNFAIRRNTDYIVIQGDHSDSFFMFSEDEFKNNMTPQTLLDAIKTAGARMEKQNANLRQAVYPVMEIIESRNPALESLNRILEYRDLYQVMPHWPDSSIKSIHRLMAGEDLKPLEIKELNRLLIEFNDTRQAPHKLLLEMNTNSGSGRIKMIHEIMGDNVTFWIFKI